MRQQMIRAVIGIIGAFATMVALFVVVENPYVKWMGLAMLGTLFIYAIAYGGPIVVEVLRGSRSSRRGSAGRRNQSER